jgi:hypothetical protein
MQRLNGLLSTAEGYLLVPHELLHVAAYRLIGKPCAYRWGEPHVRGLAPLSFREDVFVLLFPLGVACVVGFGLHAASVALLLYASTAGAALFDPSGALRVPLWYLGLTFLGTVCLGYGGASIGDVAAVYRLLSLQQARDQASNPQKDGPQK